MKGTVRVALSLAMWLAAVSLPAPPAFAACSLTGTWFKAYDGTSCSGALLLQSNAPRGSRNISVARDQTSSGTNSTANKWCGVNEGLNDQTVFVWAPNTIANQLGSADNIIDHFDVVAPGNSCPA